MIFHALVLGWLLFFSPVRVVDLTAKALPPTLSISPARAEQVMQQVREQQAAMLADEVRSLKAAQQKLAALEAQKRAELRQSATNPPVDLEKIQQAQTEALRAQTEAESAATNSVRELQALAAQHQAEALEALALTDPKFEPAYQAQAEACTAQAQAIQAQAEAEGLLSSAALLEKKNAPAAEDLAETQRMLRDFQAQLAAAGSNAIVLSNSLPQLLAAAESAKSAYDAAQAAGDKSRLNQTKQLARDAQKAAETAQKNLARAVSDRAKFQSRVAEQAARIAKFSSKANPLETGPEAMQRAAREKFQAARQLQAQAKAAQSRAAEVFSDARNGVASQSDAPSPAGESLAEVYQNAVQTEVELAEAYRRLRAADLAMERQIPLAKALELTDAARPSRPDLAPALRGGSADTAAQRQAIQEARSQVAAMRSLADSMLAQARELSGNNRAGTQQTLAALAAEDENQRAKDLTGAMKRSGSANSGKPGTSGAPAGSWSGSGSGNPGGANGGQAGGGGGSSGFSIGGVGDGASSGPPPMPKDLSAVPGRVIGVGAVPGRWMFVDSWYLLGPFDNAGRANIDKQFPPETVIDLNATYAGKRGRTVRWEFFQSALPRVVPPFDNFNPLASGAADGGAGAFKVRDLEYIIYYGYTELRAETDCDVWLAVGSDDFSKLWIEDQLVWASGKQHKPWRVDEGYRKVHLKQGVNRVLIRVENGHSQSEFSLALSAAK